MFHILNRLQYSILGLLYPVFLLYYTVPSIHIYLSALMLAMAAILLGALFIDLSMRRLINIEIFLVVNIAILILGLSTKIIFLHQSLSIVTALISMNIIYLISRSDFKFILSRNYMKALNVTFILSLTWQVVMNGNAEAYTHSVNHLSVVFLTMVLFTALFSDHRLNVFWLLLFTACLLLTRSWSNILVALLTLGYLAVSYKKVKYVIIATAIIALFFYNEIWQFLHDAIEKKFTAEPVFDQILGSLKKRLLLYKQLINLNDGLGMIMGGFYDYRIKQEVGLSIHNSYLTLLNAIGLFCYPYFFYGLHKYLKTAGNADRYIVIFGTILLARAMVDSILFTHLFPVTICLLFLSQSYNGVKS